MGVPFAGSYNVTRPAKPANDERLYPTGWVLAERSLTIGMGIRVGLTLVLWAPVRLLVATSLTLATVLREKTTTSPLRLMMNIDKYPKIHISLGLKYHILGGDAGYTAGEYYFDQQHGIT